MNIGRVLQNLESGTFDGDRRLEFSRAKRRTVTDMKPIASIGLGIRSAVELRDLPYGEYLKTPHWRSVRVAMLKRGQGKCECCRMEPEFNNPLQVHHLTYAHRGQELDHLEDLTLICRDCHSRQHFGDGDVDERVKAKRSARTISAAVSA